MDVENAAQWDLRRGICWARQIFYIILGNFLLCYGHWMARARWPILIWLEREIKNLSFWDEKLAI